MFYQYLWNEYTSIRLIEWWPKVKVVAWEIVESNLPSTYFTSNWFKKVDIETKIIDDWKPEITLKIKKKKKCNT